MFHHWLVVSIQTFLSFSLRIPGEDEPILDDFFSDGLVKNHQLDHGFVLVKRFNVLAGHASDRTPLGFWLGSQWLPGSTGPRGGPPANDNDC